MNDFCDIEEYTPEKCRSCYCNATCKLYLEICEKDYEEYQEKEEFPW